MTIHARATQRLCAAAALAAAALAPAAAHASASSSVTLSNVHIQLIDLDAADGVTPGIAFGFGSSMGGWLHPITWVNGVPVENYAEVPVGTAFGPITAANGGSFATGTMLAGDYLGATGPGVTVTADASGPDSIAWGLAYVLPVRFTLTANTRMVVTATVATNTLAATPGTTASTYASLSGSDLNNVYFANDYIQSNANDGFAFISPRTSLQISFDNAGANAYDGYLNAMASAYNISAVPEPQSVALMLAGLAVLGAGARRRSQQGR